MPGPGRWVRRSTTVEAMPLATPADLDCALLWLHAHGVPATILDGILFVRGTGGIRMPARMGQWLTHDPGSGEFTVWNHGTFVVEHSEPLQAAQ